MDKFIMSDIKRRNEFLAKIAPEIVPLDSLEKKERQYVLNVRTSNEKTLQELEDWERQPNSLRLLRLQRVLDNEVLLQARLEHFIAYQDQHDADNRNEQHILERSFKILLFKTNLEIDGNIF